MSKFIRIDTKGTWKGTEHRSCFAGSVFSTEETQWESGISCYSLEYKIEAIENLYNYWVNTAMLQNSYDYSGMQITVFEGYKVGSGSDYEDLAICIETIKVVEAYEFMKALFDAKDKFDGLFENEDGEYEDEISEEEYNKILENLI